MQHSPNEIKERLLKALDREYNVVNMAAAFEIIGILERTPITKEALERTRLGKHINELRKKTSNEALAKRAKDLVRLWRKLIIPQESISVNGDRSHQGRHSALGPGLGPPSGPGPGPTEARNSAKTGSPSLHNHRTNRLKPYSPGTSWTCASPAASSPNTTANSNHRGNHQPSSPSTYVPKFANNAPQTSPTHGIPGTIVKPGYDHRRLVGNHQIFKPVSPAVSPANNNCHPCGTNSTPSPSKSPYVWGSDSPGIPKRPPSQPKVSAISPSHNASTIRPGHSINVDVVSKTNAANKRLRKDDSGFSEGLSSSKRPGLANNISPPLVRLVNGFDGGESGDSFGSFHDSSKETVIQTSTSNEVPDNISSGINIKKPRKHQEKRNSKCANSMDNLKNKIAAAHVRTKVKTTAQLIEGLKVKNTSLPSNLIVASISNQSNLYSHSPNASPALPRRGVNLLGSDEDMTRHKTELMDKFLKDSARSATPDFSYSAAGSSHDDLSSPSTSRVLTAKPKTYLPEVDPVDEILALLPPINYDEIVWDDDDGVEVKSGSELCVNDEVVNRLQCENWEGMNGNIDSTGEFKEWHETFSRESYQGDLLHILPYVNIE